MRETDREHAIRDMFVQRAEVRLAQSPSPIVFTGNKAADALLNDLSVHPHAFVVACIMDRQMPAERAWLIPYELGRRIGSLNFHRLSACTFEEVAAAMRIPGALHRFPDIMAKNLCAAVRRIQQEYGSDASRIWAGTPPSAGIVRRFLEFEGVGQKIASMAANILVRDFRVPVSDKYSIDISVDVHVGRVFARLGLVQQGATAETLIFKARELNPEYPGVFDLAMWELGRELCRPSQPACHRCWLTELCGFS